MRSIFERVKKTVTRHGMLGNGDTVIVAVSGGPDSMALLHALCDLKRVLNLSLVVAHLNHGLRGKESDRDARFVARMSRGLRLPCVVERVRIAKKPGESLQETARTARYEFLGRTAKKYHASRIATGHTADDQAETVLMRFLRGSGRKGLGGIPPMRKTREGSIIRPLLEVAREEILGYLRGKKVGFVTDSSNRRRGYFRNRMRKEVLPLMKRFNPNLISHLGRISEIFREEDRFLDALARHEWIRAAVPSREGVSLDISVLRDCARPVQKRILMRAVKTAAGSLRGFSQVHYDMILDLGESASPNKALFLPHSVRVERQYTRLLITTEGAGRKSPWDHPPFEVPLRIPGMTRIAGPGMAVRARVIRRTMKFSELRQTSADRAYFDLDALTPPLILRSFHPGDRFQPLGLKGMKKIKDLFIEKKIPRSLRGRIPILESGEGILWLPGVRQAEKGKIHRGTRTVLQLDIVGQIAPTNVL